MVFLPPECDTTVRSCLLGSLGILKRHSLLHKYPYLLHQAISTQSTAVLFQDGSLKPHVPASRPHAHWFSCIAVWVIQGHNTHCLCDSNCIQIMFHQLFYVASFQSKVIYPLVMGLSSFWKSLPCFSISHPKPLVLYCFLTSYFFHLNSFPPRYI